MARRLSFTVAQPITIIGWYIASILLIALVTQSVHILKVPGQDRALTQAFYYAIIAAVLYFIIASLMCITVYVRTIGCRVALHPMFLELQVVGDGYAQRHV